jgi:hypothetical protein
MQPFQAEADEFIAKFGAEHDLGSVDESEQLGPTKIAYTFQSGVTVVVWRWASGKLAHKVHG